MSDPQSGTREQTPEDQARILGPGPAFAAGDPVPGLNSWVLERKLGGGGFGQVWLARHAFDREQAPRAVKFCTDLQARHRLVTHERNVVVRVMKYAGKHPNIVPLLEFNLDGAVPWLMYEYVEGGTLADLIDQWAALELPKRLGRAVKVLHGLASGLATCHRLNPPLVHRDMKPQNVLMAGAIPRITDFGIGSVAFDPASVATGATTELGARIPTALRGAGTRAYAPPEQMFGGAPNPHEDVFALGVIAYQLVVADRLAGPGADAEAELRDRKVPRELASLIVRSVALNADRRPADAGEWLTALDALIGRYRQPQEPTDTGSPSKPVLLPDPALQPTDLPQTRTVGKPEPPIAEELPEPKARRKWVAVGGVGLFLAALVPTLWFALRPAPNGGSGPEVVERPRDKEPDRFKDQPKDTPPTPPGPKDLGPPPFELKPFEPKPREKEPGEKVGPKPILAFQFPFNPKPGQECDIEIAAGAKMRFCWVPGNKCQFGAPRAERDAVLKSLNLAREPDWLRAEGEDVRGIFFVPGFWMGKYEVTQVEWAAVMRGTKDEMPSYFVPSQADVKKAGITDTSRFPVENVSWDMICEPGGFLDRANAFTNGAKGDVRRGRLCLPHEDEWEYACRGGLGNGRPFYFGMSCNGTEANCDGSRPLGTTTKGDSLKRTVAVGSYEGKAPHPWGLCDMHGNVWEWCQNKNDKANDCALRGGSWNFAPDGCRAAGRNWNAPGSRYDGYGFRVCVRLE